MQRFLRAWCPEAEPTLKRAGPNASAVVLCLGWGGAKKRNLRKVLAHYEGKGYATVSMVAPLFVPRAVERYFEDKACDLIQQVQREGRGRQVYVHLWSNNGAWCYTNIMKRKDVVVDKVVWDASPSGFYEDGGILHGAQQLSRVLVSIVLNKNQYEHPVFTPLITLALLPTLLFILASHYLGDAIGVEIMPNWVKRNHALRDTSPVVPSLFMYSEGDELVRPTEVRAFQASLRARGVPVSEHVFDASVPHTAAFFTRTEEYVRTLDAFLADKVIK